MNQCGFLGLHQVFYRYYTVSSASEARTVGIAGDSCRSGTFWRYASPLALSKHCSFNSATVALLEHYSSSLFDGVDHMIMDPQIFRPGFHFGT